MLFVAVLGYSRREYVQAFLSQRHDDWREGLANAFRHFGGITQTVLIDNARALVLERDRERKTARIHPAFDAFCRDWGVTAQACQPYRARTKGKTERGVGYAKHNALAGRRFESFAALEAHLVRWMAKADERVHGTTHELPRVRFERAEAAALRPLPMHPLPVRQRRLARKVSSDCFVDVDTVRYSVPHALVRRRSIPRRTPHAGPGCVTDPTPPPKPNGPFSFIAATPRSPPTTNTGVSPSSARATLPSQATTKIAEQQLRAGLMRNSECKQRPTRLVLGSRRWRLSPTGVLSSSKTG